MVDVSISSLNLYRVNNQQPIAAIETLPDASGIKVLKRWARDLRFGIEQSVDSQEWDLIGRAVFLLTDDAGYACKLFALLANEAGFSFSRLRVEDLARLTSTVNSLNSTGPALIYLEPGEWSSPIDRELPDLATASRLSLQREIKKIISALDPMRPLIFATSGRKSANLDRGFRQKGYFDQFFEIAELSIEEMGRKFLNQVGKDLCSESLLAHPVKVGALLKSECNDSRRQGLFSIALKRLSRREKRSVEFVDISRLAMYGINSSDSTVHESEAQRLIVATHEAGHLIVAMLDSEGKNVPEFCSAHPENGIPGMVAHGIEGRQDTIGFESYNDFRCDIRICLGGRAAEHLIFGQEGVTVRGANSDLYNATKLCHEMFSECGIPHDMGQTSQMGSNLAVFDNDAGPSESWRYKRMIRSYLKEQYEYVLSLLSRNQKLLEAVRDRLMSQSLLDRNELIALFDAVGGTQ